ncbi:outer membrane beta-barrel protein [Lacinutrix jangbogonensis]|uniref:outer membrane beta-barrel protein n=1 Tax=Lacinutrix jangbogonensis TaxID=1469557 RepID=UPI00053CF699|nr:outer membrane beta-barrel protein [Lacinutrix jangbogonensis]
MKQQRLLFLIFIALFSSYASAQSFEITPSYGYQFGTKLNYGPNYIKMEDGGQFGINLAFELQPSMMLDVSYYNMNSETRIRDVFIAPFERRLTDLNLDWFLIGATRYFKQGPLKPFVGAGLGMVLISPENENLDIVNSSFSSETRFAFSFKAGVNYMFTDIVGINLQGNLFFPVNYGGFYFGSGGAGVNTGSTLIFGGFSGGLVFKIDTN